MAGYAGKSLGQSPICLIPDIQQCISVSKNNAWMPPKNVVPLYAHSIRCCLEMKRKEYRLIRLLNFLIVTLGTSWVEKSYISPTHCNMYLGLGVSERTLALCSGFFFWPTGIIRDRASKCAVGANDKVSANPSDDGNLEEELFLSVESVKKTKIWEKESYITWTWENGEESFNNGGGDCQFGRGLISQDEVLEFG